MFAVEGLCRYNRRCWRVGVFAGRGCCEIPQQIQAKTKAGEKAFFAADAITDQAKRFAAVAPVETV
jgi:hypothetical protein